MRRAMIAGAFLIAAGTGAGPAAAASLNDAFYVQKGAAGTAMLTDRAACVTEAQQFGVDRASDFSNPEYGSLTALGAALDEDALHGGAKQAVRGAVRDACMQKKGWIKASPSDEEVKTLRRASLRHPEALDAWLAANQPKTPPTAIAAAQPAPAKSVAPTDAKPTDPAAPKS